VIAALLGDLLPWIVGALAMVAGAIGLFFSGRRSGGVAARQAQQEADNQGREKGDAAAREADRAGDPVGQLRRDWSR
jgi:hypothetical protein